MVPSSVPIAVFANSGDLICAHTWAVTFGRGDGEGARLLPPPGLGKSTLRPAPPPLWLLKYECFEFNTLSLPSGPHDRGLPP